MSTVEQIADRLTRGVGGLAAFAEPLADGRGNANASGVASALREALSEVRRLLRAVAEGAMVRSAD